MKRTTTATGLLTLLAMLVLGAFSAGSASAHDFSWTGPLPGLVLVLSDNPQFFEASPGFSITCKHFGGHGIATNGKLMTTKTIVITGLFSQCEAVGGFAAKVSPAEFELSAEETVGVIGKPIVITIPGVNCSIKVSNGGANAALKTIRYLKDPLNSSAILAHVEVSKIVSFGSGGICGEPTEEKPIGLYRGLLLAFIHGGIIRWT
jgi:hypothetical protein